MIVDSVSGSVFTSAKSALKTIKHSAGQIVRAPGEIAEGISKAAQGAGAGVASTTKAVPVVLIIAAVGVAGYLLFMGKAGKKVTPSISGIYPELLGRRRRRSRR